MKEESGKLHRGKTDLYFFFFYFCTKVKEYIKGFAQISRFKEETIKRQKTPKQTKNQPNKNKTNHHQSMCTCTFTPDSTGITSWDARMEPGPSRSRTGQIPGSAAVGREAGRGQHPRALRRRRRRHFAAALPPPSCERGAVPDPWDGGSWHCPGQGEPQGARPCEPEGTQTEPLPQGARAAVTRGCCYTVPAWV